MHRVAIPVTPGLPMFELQAEGIRLTSLDFPHRYADAYIRDSLVDGVRLDLKPAGRTAIRRMQVPTAAATHALRVDMRILFRHAGKQHAFTLGEVSQEEAETKSAQVDYLLLRLKQRLAVLPPGVEIG